MAVDAASLRMVIDSISFGLIRLSGLDTPDTAVVPSGFFVYAKGTPSITINGSLLALREAPPRMRMVLPLPGAPPFDMIETPGALPAINCSGVVIDPFWKSFEVTVLK